MLNAAFIRLLDKALAKPELRLKVAELLKDFGDIRHAAVHNHALCCDRSRGIINYILRKQDLILSKEELEGLDDGTDPAKWPCT